jgi:hypothetical protein
MGANLQNITCSAKRGPLFIDCSGGRKNASPQIAVRFDEKTMREIKRRADAQKTSAAKIIRELVRRAFAAEYAEKSARSR